MSFQHEGWNFEVKNAPQSDLSQFMSQQGYPSIPPPHQLNFPHMGFTFTVNGLSCLKRWTELQREYNIMDYIINREEKNTGVKVSQKTYDATYQQDYEADIVVDRKIVTAYFRQAKLIEDSPRIGERVPTRLEIPKGLQIRKEDLIFYDNIDLYNDDLQGHGRCDCNAKLRVMNQFFIVQLQYFLHVFGDRVLLREVRFYHRFGDQMILQETTVREATIEDLRCFCRSNAPEDQLATVDVVREALDPSFIERKGIAADVRKNYVF